MPAIKFPSSLNFNLIVSADIDEHGIDDFKVMLAIGGIELNITHSLTKEQRADLEREAMNLSCGRTVWGGI
jgi:hypothetical protein